MRSRLHTQNLGGKVIAAIGLLLICGAAGADPVRYEYGGVITSADPSMGVSPGTPFTGTITYDPTARASYGLAIEGSSQSIFTTSPYYPAPSFGGSDLTLSVGGQTVLANSGGIQLSVSEIQFPGQFGYTDASGNPRGPSTSVGFSTENVSGNPLDVWVGLTNPTQSLFPSLAMPSVLSLADFPQAQLAVSELTNSGSKALYAGTIDSLVELPVPEPAYGILICLASIGWFVRRSSSRVPHAP